MFSEHDLCRAINTCQYDLETVGFIPMVFSKQYSFMESNSLNLSYFRWYIPAIVGSVIILILFIVMYIKLYREYSVLYEYNEHPENRKVRA